MAGKLPPGYLPPTRDPLTLIRAWCAGKRTSDSQEQRIAALLSKEHLLQLPLLPRTRRRVGVIEAQWLRFLWRRHVQYIMHWGERREEGEPNGFTHDINWLLRVVLFPDEPSIEKDGYHARGGTSRGEDKGRCTDWCKGAVASGIASATTQASVCSEERSTGRSVEPTFDRVGSPDPGAANSPGAERRTSNSRSSPPRAAAASRASRRDHGGGPSIGS
jgi:hypothetical protein